MAYFITGGHPLPDEKQAAIDRRGNSAFEAMDGNTQKTRLIEPSQDDGLRIREGQPNAGRPLCADNVPAKLRRVPWSLDRVPLLDVETFSAGTLLVCQAFKDLLEDLEPDVHQFWPMEIYLKGEKVALRYWLVICNRIRSLSREHCYPPLDERGFWDPSPLGQRENDRLVYSKEAIGDCHAWVDSFHMDRMFSDTVGDRIIEKGLTGLRLNKKEEA